MHWVNEAYQMYIQGISYKAISQDLNVNLNSLRYHIKRYAYKNDLSYPRIKPNYQLAFNLYMNTMSVNDIARYMGVSPSSIRNYIRRYSEMNGIPHGSSSRDLIAYNLRELGYTYEKIAKMLNYNNRSNCYRAIKNYKINKL